MEVAARQRLDALAKPLRSLGLLEDWATTLAAVQSSLRPAADPASVLVFVADHGLKKADAAISPYPPAVTGSVFRALAAGVSATATLAQACNAHLTIVDVGIDGDVSDVQQATAAITVAHCKVSEGTRDCRTAPAMDAPTLARAIEVGREQLAAEVAERAVRVVAIGEVGIGNTTIAAALLSLLTGADPAECCGRGTGVDDAGLAHKVQVVRSVCAEHAASIADAGDEAARARVALERVGGLELAAMAGAFMEAGARGVVAVVDGFISAVASLAAVRMEPGCRKNMLFATAFEEEPEARRGGAVLAEALGAQVPALAMGLCLGEGSGAVLALPLVRAAAAVMGDMATLEQALALGCGPGTAAD